MWPLLLLLLMVNQLMVGPRCPLLLLLPHGCQQQAARALVRARECCSPLLDDGVAEVAAIDAVHGLLALGQVAQLVGPVGGNLRGHKGS